MSERIPPKVQIEEIRGSEWAKEVTLASLATAVGNSNLLLRQSAKQIGKSNELLKAMGGDKTKDIRLDLSEVTELRTRIRGATSSVEDYGKATRNLSDALTGTTTALYNTTRSISNNAANLASSSDTTTGFMRTLTSVGSQAVGAIGRFPLVGGIAAAGMTAVGVAAGIVVDRLISTRKAFMDMTQSGLYFSGNAMDFANQVRTSGLELQEFTSIAEKYNVALLTSAGAESGYLRQIHALGSTFDRLNMNVRDGAEYFAEFLDISRVSNRAYMQDEKAQREAFEKNALIQQELARLTGVTVKQQREQARGVAASRQMRAFMMSRPQDAERMGQAVRNVGTVTGFDQKTLDELALFAMTGRALSGDLQNMAQLSPEMFNRLVQEIRTGGTPESGRELVTRQAQFGQSIQGTTLASQVEVGLANTRMSGGYGLLVDAFYHSLGLDPNRRGAAGGPPSQTVDADTLSNNALISNLVRTIGALDATAIKASEEALKFFRTEIDQLSAALNEISPKTITDGLKSIRDTFTSMHETFQTIERVMGSVGETLKSVRDYVRDLTGLTTGHQLAVAGGVAGAAGLAGAAYLGRAAIKGGAGLLSRVSGPLSLGLGVHSAATGETRGERMLGVGGAAAGGAMTGAAIGGLFGGVGAVPGAAIGGLLGAGAGLLANYFGSGGNQNATATATATAPPAVGTFFNDVILSLEEGFTKVTQSMDRVNETSKEGNTEQRDLMLRLIDAMDRNTSVLSNSIDRL